MPDSVAAGTCINRQVCCADGLPADWLAHTHEWICRSAVHMDCLHWVNRDSYLPQGSRGLKVPLCRFAQGKSVVSTWT